MREAGADTEGNRGGAAPRRMKSGQAVLAALGLLALYIGLVGSGAAQRTEALRVWRRSETAGQRVPMRAEMTLVVHRHGRTHEARAQCIRAADGRYRLDYLAPLPARGRIVWFDGKCSWQLEPRRGVLIRTGLGDQSASASASDLALVERNYRMNLASDHATAGGRPAYLLEVRPATAGKGRQRRWVDKATFRTLRVDTYYADGTLARSLSYDHITLPARVPDSELKPAAPAGVRVVRTVEPAQRISSSKARTLAQELGLRTDGPRGFRLDRAMSGRVGAQSVTQLLYTDGLETVSVFVQNCPAAPTDIPPGWRPVSLRGLPALEHQGEHTDTLIWVSDGRRYTAISQIAGDALEEFASRLSR